MGERLRTEEGNDRRGICIVIVMLSVDVKGVVIFKYDGRCLRQRGILRGASL